MKRHALLPALSLAAFGLLLVPLAGMAQTTRLVPEDYATIQGALDAAEAGDVVVVRPGVYGENLVWPETPALKLVSTAGPDSTTIDGQGRGSVLRIESAGGAIDASTLVRGFTLTGGGNVDYGGGLFLQGARPTLLDLVVTGNAAAVEGGGLYLAGGADAVFVNLVVQGNEAGGSGGGFRSTGSEPLIIGSEITGNRGGAERGGGIHTDGGTTRWIDHRSRANASGGR